MTRRFVTGMGRTKEYLAAVHSLRNLENAGGSPGRAYAEAECEKALHQWAQKHGLTRSKGHVCLTRLVWHCKRSHGCAQLAGSDHASLWLKDGKPHVYVSQPYGLSLETLLEMVSQCQELGLEIHIGTWPAWHFPGTVLMVEVRRRESRAG